MYRRLIFLLVFSSLMPLLEGAEEDEALTTVSGQSQHVQSAKASQLSGTVVDTSGATIADVNIEVLSANGGTQRTTQSDTNGAFSISGLPPGDYQLIVSSPRFKQKQCPSP